jgi:translation initiation factor 5B
MPPKKKNNKKADDWESELGESVDPIAAATQAAKEEEAAKDAEEEEAFPATGLMAAMKKNRNKRKIKGKPVDDFGDDENQPAAEEPDLAVKAPEEATMEDEFALPDKRGKAKSGDNGAAKPAKDEKDEDEDEDEERGADGKLLSKKEKEKLKKEREKQRKKEQVGACYRTIWLFSILIDLFLGRKKEDHYASCQSRSCEARCRKESRT